MLLSDDSLPAAILRFMSPVTPETTLMSLLRRQGERLGDRTALSVRDGDQWRELSYASLARQSAALAAILRDEGIRDGDRVAIISESRPEWSVGFFGAFHAGAVIVPLDPRADEQELGLILSDCAPVAILASFSSREKASALASAHGIQILVLLNGSDSRFLDSSHTTSGGIFEAKRSSNETALLAYTSGTTGRPKGVMITPANLLFEMQALTSCHRLTERDVFLSVLPLNHLLELTCGLLTVLYAGGEVVYSGTLLPEDLVDVMKTRRVTTMIGVPLLFRVLHRAIESGASRTPATRWWFLTARTWARFLPSTKLRRILFLPLHRRFGGRLVRLISGGSALDPLVVSFFDSIGLPLYQGYGLTETSPVATVNAPGAVRDGSVGRGMGAEIRIEKRPGEREGEILIRGPQVMKGYFNDVALTAEMIDSEGWFHSGDIGRLDRGAFLYVTGRLKDVIVLADGRKVHPAEVEAHLTKANGIIKDACVVSTVCLRGERKGTEEVCAVIVPGDEFRNNATADEIQPNIENEVRRLCRGLRDFKRPSRVVIRLTDLPKTLTLKTRRAEVRKWLEQIDHES